GARTDDPSRAPAAQGARRRPPGRAVEVSTVAPCIDGWRVLSIELMLCRRGRRTIAPTVLRLNTGHNLGHNHRCTNGPGRSVDARVAFLVKTRNAGRECSDASSCQHVPHWSC